MKGVEEDDWRWLQTEVTDSSCMVTVSEICMADFSPAYDVVHHISLIFYDWFIFAFEFFLSSFSENVYSTQQWINVNDYLYFVENYSVFSLIHYSDENISVAYKLFFKTFCVVCKPLCCPQSCIYKSIGIFSVAHMEPIHFRAHTWTRWIWGLAWFSVDLLFLFYFVFFFWGHDPKFEKIPKQNKPCGRHANLLAYILKLERKILLQTLWRHIA